MRNPDLIITGVSGWLGKRLLRSLIENEVEGVRSILKSSTPAIRVLLEDKSQNIEIDDSNLEKIYGDIRDSSTLKRLFLNTEGATVIHLAGCIHPKIFTKDFMNVNFRGTCGLLQAATNSQVRKIVVMSSNSPIGASKDWFEIFDEESPYQPYMGYGRSKMEMEKWLLREMSNSGIPQITIIRAPWFYGPEQPLRQTRFFSMIKEGRFPLMGEGNNRRSMGYVDSLAEGILLAAVSEKANGQIYWLSDERPYSMIEIVTTVSDVMRDDFGITVAPKVLRVPGFISDIARVSDFLIQSVGLYNQEIHVLSEMNLTIACSIEKAKEDLGYSPKVDLREGMRRSIDWLLKTGVTL